MFSNMNIIIAFFINPCLNCRSHASHKHKSRNINDKRDKIAVPTQSMPDGVTGWRDRQLNEAIIVAKSTNCIAHQRGIRSASLPRLADRVPLQ